MSPWRPWPRLSALPPPEGVAPVDHLVVGRQELAGDLHVCHGQAVVAATTWLEINEIVKSKVPNPSPKSKVQSPEERDWDSIQFTNQFSLKSKA